MPKISIVLPVYNVEKYLRQCLDSIINQTFTDFECICVNDGSTDTSLEILQEYEKKDNRIKIISQENKGLSGARNTGLKYITGQYITFIDSDDFVSIDYLKILYNEIEKEDYDIVIGNLQYYYTKDNKFVNFNKVFNINNKTLSFDKFIAGYNFGAVWARLFKKQFIENNNMAFLEKVLVEDYLFSIVSYLSTNKIISTSKVIYYYRKQISSIMSNFDKVTISQFYNNFYLIKELRKRKINDSKIENYLVKNFFHNYSDIYKRIKNGNYSSLEELYNKSLDVLKFYNTIKKDLKFKYQITIPIVLRLFVVLKLQVLKLRNLFKLIC